MHSRIHQPAYVFVVRLDRVDVLADDMPAAFGDPPMDHLLTFPTSSLNLNRRYRPNPAAADEKYRSVFDDPDLESELAAFAIWHDIELKLRHDEMRRRWSQMQVPLVTPAGRIVPGAKALVELERVVSATNEFDPGGYTYLGINTEIQPPRPLFMNKDFKMVEVPWPPEVFPWHDRYRISPDDVSAG